MQIREIDELACINLLMALEGAIQGIKKTLLNLAASELNTSLRNIARYQYSREQKVDCLKEIDNLYVRSFLHCSKIKYVFMAWCLKFSVRFYLILLKLL